MATIVEQTHMADGEFRTFTTDAASRSVIVDALRDRMRLIAEHAANARRMGREAAARDFLAAHNEASDVLAGIEAGT